MLPSPDDDPRATWGFRTLPLPGVPALREPGAPVLTREDWIQEGLRLFGPDKRRWTFRCPACGQAQSVADFLRHGLDPQGKVFNTCLGALLPPGAATLRKPCAFSLAAPGHAPALAVLHDGREVDVMPFADPFQPTFRAR